MRMYTCVRLLCDCVCVLLRSFCVCVLLMGNAAVNNLDPQPWAPWPYKYMYMLEMLEERRYTWLYMYVLEILQAHAGSY